MCFHFWIFDHGLGFGKLELEYSLVCQQCCVQFTTPWMMNHTMFSKFLHMDVMTFFVQGNMLMLEEADQSWGP